MDKKMLNRLANIAAAAILIAAVLFLQSCGGNNPAQTPADKATALLTAPTWKLRTVLADGVDQSTFFKDMTIKFTNGNYSTSNGGAVWGANGTWTFTDNAGTAFKRNDGINVSISDLTASTLTLQLTWTKSTLGSGRNSSVVGSYVFAFSN